jgi:hypothetical protein
MKTIRAVSLFAVVAVIISTVAYASGAIPDASTPGAVDPAVTQANIHQTICVPGYSRSETAQLVHVEAQAPAARRRRHFRPHT